MGLRIIDPYRGIWAQTNHATSLYYLLFTILGGLILSFLVGGVFCQLIYGISFFSSSNVAFDPNNNELIEAMKLMQLFNALGTFVLPPIVFLHLKGLSFYKYLKLENSLRINMFIPIVLMALAMIPVANYLGSINESLPLPEFLNFLKAAEEQSLLLTEKFLEMDGIYDLLFMIVMMGAVAAIGEELLFRGVLQNAFQSWSGSKHLAVWFTALLFSVIHLQYHAILPRFLLGAFIGYVYTESSNLRASMLLHFLYNTTLIIITFGIQNGSMDASLEKVGLDNVMLPIACLFILVLSLVKFLPNAVTSK
jgi:membrane protease YdiL (CAAX protease family)